MVLHVCECMAVFVYFILFSLTHRFAAMSQTPHPTMEVIQLLQNMNGLLGLTTPTDDSTHSLEGLLGE